MYLRYELDEQVILIAVGDVDPTPPIVRDPHPYAEHGRGLGLVTKLAQRMGWERSGSGKTVWCVLAVR